ncbi:SusC/RagA family TonB-linked outer membrane protein [Psychroflexus montanilacus]|uniref:SusC/RagA family TonB-linked outer membrane protein n=1 Tax=Psychroflexus montanilacus TaxID=2873598 RepID=UPI001CCA53B3|nr:SusC/RagA family TonB-linked outer membrane protein [Psychroflexus montanilacus]MBZ9651507.1 SusC/RagA family TonB-linked outer membrane protein [Psychroflexus montanilacus]
MRTKLSGILTLFLALVVQVAVAQTKTVTGTVTDDSGLPLPGANVLVKGTTNGTQTDFDGNYSIEASADQSLVFTYIGFSTATVKVGNQTEINLQMESGEALDEVVVVGFGTSREKKSLGYAVSQVESEGLEQRAEGDLGRVLNGKASGVVINSTSGISGSATNINIRGFLSINNSNQPLFIVDGVPISNDTNASGNFVNGNSGSSRSLDLDPNAIESVSVLKGFAAATVYGSDGRNGVILITTKAGSAGQTKKKNEITVSQGIFFNEIASLPDYSERFGNGFDGAFGNFFSNWGPGFYEEGFGGWGASTSGISPDGTYTHPYNRANLANVFPEFQGQTLPWEASNRGVSEFFRTGVVRNTSVNVASTSDDGKLSYNVNFGHLDDDGFTPGNNTTRTNFSVGGRALLSNKFTVNSTINVSRTDFKTPPVALSSGSGVTGTGLSVFADVFYTPTNIPLMDLPFQNPVTGASVYYRADEGIVNPNWVVNNSFVNQVTSRMNSSNTITYDVNDNFNFLYRVGLDVYSERNESGQNIGANAGSVLGSYRSFTNTNIVWDHNFQVNGNYDLTSDINLNFTVGGNARYNKFDQDGVNSSGQIVFDVFRHFNFREQTPQQSQNFRNIIGLYGTADFEYKDYLYFNLSARNDWVSNQIDNSQFYPSTSVSFLPTSAFTDLRSKNGLNYLKVRAGYGTSAGFAQGFPTVNTLPLNARFFTPQGSASPIANNSLSRTLANTEIRPELFEEYEVGLEARALDNRLTFDFSYFQRNTTDLIINRPLAPSTGFTLTQFNIGKLEGYGFEGDLGYRVIQNEGTGFNWDVNINYTKYRSDVTDLGLEPGADPEDSGIVYAGFTNSIGNSAVEGFPFSSITGSSIARDENGNPLVNSSGLYVVDQGPNVIGDATPDFLMNYSTTLSYKNLSLNALISYQHGGDIYSETIGTLLGRGVTTDTDNRLDTYILPGVSETTGQVNTTQINNSSYYFDVVGLQGPDETRVYDGSFIRLAEVSLTYSFPKDWLETTPFGSLSLSLAGYNLYFDAPNTPDGVNFDPNIIGTGVGNGRGLDFINGPSGKRYGFTLRATF